jgi:ribosomal protein L11
MSKTSKSTAGVAKVNLNTLKLTIPSTKATLTPPIGPILGQYGVPGQKFCQEFNDKTKNIKVPTLIKVKLNLKGKTIIASQMQILVLDIIRRSIINKQINIKRIYQLALISQCLNTKISKDFQLVDQPSIKNSEQELINLCKSYISTAHSMKAVITR